MPSRCCIRSGSPRRSPRSTASPRKIPPVPSPTGASRSADGAIRLPDSARRSRSSSGAPPFRRRRRPGSPTPRERAYIAAAAELFTSGDASTQRARTLAYEQGMERVVAGIPGDMEARIFYALAVNQTALASDKQYSQQLKAAAILEPLFKEHPKHPGLAHYIIHAYDHPPLADKALAAARSYASLAPSVPHALHMPSHTFTRVGLWKESIETNRRSAEAARKENATAEELHAMDYQTYAYLQIAKDADARRMTDEARGRVCTARRERDRRGGARRCGCLRGRSDSRALRAGTWRMGRSGLAAGAAKHLSAYRRDHAFRARARRRAIGKSEGRGRRHRTARRPCAMR